MALFDSQLLPFPASKAQAILSTYGVDGTDHGTQSTVLTVTPSLDPNYAMPPFAQHDTPDLYNQQAATIVHLAVEIGAVNPTHNEVVDWFNGMVMQLFNLASGNLLQVGNVLSWNVWALAPEEVYTPEWEQHAQYWRFSLDVNHRSPESNGRNPQYYDGTPFNAEGAAICALLQDLLDGLKARFPHNSLVQEIEEVINLILATACGGPVQFL